MSNDVKVYKMINGEDIMGEVFIHFADSIELKNPAQIVLQRTETGMGVALAPYMPFADGNVKIHKHAIASECTPDQNMINEYNRIFGSGIQVAPASALAGLQIAK
jgi:hypothetical protein